jgi:hypothetical protein
MTIDEHIAATEHLLALQRAVAAGKRLQSLDYDEIGGVWVDMCVVISDWSHIASNPYDYRIKPEPKIRPWEPEEVPLGALYRLKANDHGGKWVIINEPSRETVLQLFYGGEWCWPHEQYDNVWRPCGVVES